MWTCLLLSRRESKEGLDRPEGRPLGENAGLRASPLRAGEAGRQRGLSKVLTQPQSSGWEDLAFGWLTSFPEVFKATQTHEDISRSLRNQGLRSRTPAGR